LTTSALSTTIPLKPLAFSALTPTSLASAAAGSFSALFAVTGGFSPGDSCDSAGVGAGPGIASEFSGILVCDGRGDGEDFLIFHGVEASMTASAQIYSFSSVDPITLRAKCL
jgi:hypothetical protein